MPFYTWLRPRSGDSPQTLQTKQRASQKLKNLRDALEKHFDAAVLAPGIQLPSDSSRYVRIATWNLREFDAPSYGQRSQEAKAYIAEILSHFDLIALQEIRRDLGPLDDVKNLLGPSWGYITTDVTEGSSATTSAWRSYSIATRSGSATWRASSRCRRARRSRTPSAIDS